LLIAFKWVSMLKKRRHDTDRQTKWNRFSRTSTAKDPLSSDPGCSTVPLSNAVNITVNQRQRRIDVFLLPSSFGFSLWVLSCRFFISSPLSRLSFHLSQKCISQNLVCFLFAFSPLIPFSILFWPIIFAWPLRHCTILFWVGLTWFYSAPVAPISSTLFFWLLFMALCFLRLLQQICWPFWSSFFSSFSLPVLFFLLLLLFWFNAFWP